MASVAVSAAEREYVVAGIVGDLREDGRARGEYRRFELETGVAANTNGSARLRVGPTDVLVGIKMEVAAPDPDTPDQGRVEVRRAGEVTLCPNQSPACRAANLEACQLHHHRAGATGRTSLITPHFPLRPPSASPSPMVLLALQFSVDCSGVASPSFGGRGGETLAAQLARVLASVGGHDGAVDLKVCVGAGPWPSRSLALARFPATPHRPRLRLICKTFVPPIRTRHCALYQGSRSGLPVWTHWFWRTAAGVCTMPFRYAARRPSKRAQSRTGRLCETRMATPSILNCRMTRLM